MSLRVVRPNDSQHFRDRLMKRFGVLLTASDMWPLRDKLREAKLISQQGPIRIYHMWIHGSSQQTS